MNNEQNEKRGRFISELRKSQNLTQKDIAEKLRVTDKAVSKWERGISCPDVGLFVPLAKVLGVTAAELLSGEKNLDSEKEEEKIVEEALLYSGHSNALKSGRVKKNVLAVLSGCFLIAIITCVICDLCIEGRLTWSLIVLLSVIFSWVVLLPLFIGGEKIIRKALSAASLLILPYLFLLSRILSEPAVFSFGAIVAVISLLGLWCAYAVFVKMKSRIFCAAAILLLISVPVDLGINYTAHYFFEDSSIIGFEDRIDILINIGAMLFLSITCFIIDFFKAGKRRLQGK